MCLTPYKTNLSVCFTNAATFKDNRLTMPEHVTCVKHLPFGVKTLRWHINPCDYGLEIVSSRAKETASVFKCGERSNLNVPLCSQH